MPSNSISYTNLASILLKEINKVRTDPRSLIPYLTQRLSKYDKSNRYHPLTGFNFSVLTEQGSKAVENLIQFLESQRQVSEVEWSYPLHLAANKRSIGLASEQEENQVACLEVGQLVAQFSEWKGHLIELTFYGFIDPKEFISELLIDDGNETKENREEFFNHMSNFMGIGVSQHPKYKFVIVLIYAMHLNQKQPKKLRQRNNSIEFSINETEEREPPACGQNCAIY